MKNYPGLEYEAYGNHIPLIDDDEEVIDQISRDVCASARVPHLYEETAKE